MSKVLSPGYRNGITIYPFVWCFLSLGIALSPLYVFESGTIQPAHVAVVVAIFAYLAFFRFSFPSYLTPLLVLTAYTFVVESFYAITSPGTPLLIVSAYYLFNLLVVLGMHDIFTDKGFSPLSIGLIGALGIAAAGVVLMGYEVKPDGEQAVRAIGTFNNPNQLGYFSVCAACLSVVMYRLSYWKGMLTVGCVGLSLALAVASLSKAAIVAVALVPMFMWRVRLSPLYLLRAIVLCILLLFVLLFYVDFSRLEDTLVYQRFAGMKHESDSSLDARGYFAFLEATGPQFLFGLGAENVYRIVGHEVHSTAFTFLNGYGLIGFLLFTFVILAWWRKLTEAFGIGFSMAVVGPPMLYGLTHNGSRFMLFWILFAASLAAVRVKTMKAQGS